MWNLNNSVSYTLWISSTRWPTKPFSPRKLWRSLGLSGCFIPVMACTFQVSTLYPTGIRFSPKNAQSWVLNTDLLIMKVKFLAVAVSSRVMTAASWVVFRCHCKGYRQRFRRYWGPFSALCLFFPEKHLLPLAQRVGVDIGTCPRVNWRLSGNCSHCKEGRANNPTSH